MKRLLLALGLSLFGTAVASADAKGAVEAYFLSGFGDGEFDGTVDVPLLGERDFSGDIRLDPTLGFGLRGESFVHDYFAVGGGAEFSWYRPDDGDSVFHLDLSINLRPRYLLFGDGNMALEIYALVPIGFSRLASRDVQGLSGEEEIDAMLGWHIGASAGARLRINRFAIFSDVGWRRTQLFDDDLQFLANQFRFHLGASVAL